MLDTVSSIRDCYRDAFRTLGTNGSVPEIEISYYPYVGINHTIRIRDGRALVRIAEICRGMPMNVHRALATILVSKLFRRPVPRAADTLYSEFTSTEIMRRLAAESKRKHGRKVITSAEGEVYDLEEIFRRLNQRFFQGRLEEPTLTWSARRTYRTLGHHDATHKTIVVSRSLDSRRTPQYVIDYIVFHEMLHIHHPTVHHNGRRYHHTPEFRRDERKFPHYRAAEKWIEDNVRRLKRAAKKKR
jgi:hypothetical protein